MGDAVQDLTIMGIPAHPLIVHAMVVGTPVLTLVTLVMLIREPWRGRWAWPVAAVAVLLAVTSLVASSTGRGLQEALGGTVAEEHAEFGELVPWFTGAVAVTAVAFALLRRRGRLAAVLSGIALAVSSVAAVVWIVLTGHSGAQSVWGFVDVG